MGTGVGRVGPIAHAANDADRLLKIRHALTSFTAVYTTCYDLISYWAMMNAGVPPGAGFGDMWEHINALIENEEAGGS